jgi:DNA modification methylase
MDYDGHAGSKREGIDNDKMSKGDFVKFLDAVCSNLHKFCNGAEYICMSSAELDTLKQSFVKAGGHFQNYIIWVKQHFTLTGSDYQHKYEPILYGWPEGVVNHYYVGYRDKANVWEDLNEVGTEFDGEYTSIKFGGYEVRVLGQVAGEVHRKKSNDDVWRFDRPTKSLDHPTMKPLALCEEAIRNSSLRDGLVLDLFGGSGSTLIAADRQGRVCRMMELDNKYVDVIIKRWMKHSKEPVYRIVDAAGNQVNEPVEFADMSFMGSKT